MKIEFSQIHQTLKKIIDRLNTTENRIQEMSAKIATLKSTQQQGPLEKIQEQQQQLLQQLQMQAEIRAMQPLYPLLSPVAPKPAAVPTLKPVAQPGTTATIVKAAEFSPGCQHIFYDRETPAKILQKHAHNQQAFNTWISNSSKGNQSLGFQLEHLSDEENIQLIDAYHSKNFGTITNLINLYCKRTLMVNALKIGRIDLISQLIAQGYNLNAIIVPDGK